MATEARYRYPRAEYHGIATAALTPGQVITLADGRAAVVMGNGPIAIGDAYTACTEGTFEVNAASGTTFADGAAVQFNDTTKLAVASGDFAVGKAVGAKSSGSTFVLVALNI